MEILIKSGTKDELPKGSNTEIYIDGKKLMFPIDKFYFSVNADELAKYSFSLNK